MENGKPIWFDQYNYDMALLAWTKHLIPSINSLSEQYNLLGVGLFKQDVFLEVVNGGVENIRTKYIEKGKSGLKGFKLLPAVLDSIVADLDKGFKSFAEAASKLKEAKGKADSTNSNSSVRLNYDDCKIVDCMPELNEEALRKRYELRIETDKQKELYEKLVNVKTHWDSLVDFVVSHGWNLKISGIYGYREMIMEGDDGKLFINPEAIKFVQ